jgi:hypothetical protein
VRVRIASSMRIGWIDLVLLAGVPVPGILK